MGDFVIKAFGGYNHFIEYHKQPINLRTTNHLSSRKNG